MSDPQDQPDAGAIPAGYYLAKKATRRVRPQFYAEDETAGAPDLIAQIAALPRYALAEYGEPALSARCGVCGTTYGEHRGPSCDWPPQQGRTFLAADADAVVKLSDVLKLLADAGRPVSPPPCAELVAAERERCARIVEQAAIPGHSVAGPARHAAIAAKIREGEPPAIPSPQKVNVLPSAIAGLTDALGGDSGAIRIELGDHEIGDMVMSGQAYSLDGKYNFIDRSHWLERLRELRAAIPSSAALPQREKEKP